MIKKKKEKNCRHTCQLGQEHNSDEFTRTHEAVSRKSALSVKQTGTTNYIDYTWDIRKTLEIEDNIEALMKQISKSLLKREYAKCIGSLTGNMLCQNFL